MTGAGDAEAARLRLERRPGAGPPLLLLHGFTGAPSAWHDVLARLAVDLDVVLPWLPGHGPAPAPESWTATVAALATTLDELDPRPWGVAGYSMGGRLALDLARRCPHRVRWLVAIGARPGVSAATRVQRRAADDAWARCLREDGLEAFAARWEALPMWASQAALPAAVRARQGRVRRQHRAVGLAAALEALGPAAMPDLLPRLRDLTMPVRLVVGELDAAYRELGREMARRLPHGAVHVVPGVGHNVLLEAPDAVAAAIAAGDAEGGNQHEPA